MDSAEADDLLAQAERLGAIVFVDHIHLFHPAYRRLKKEVERSGGTETLRLVNGNKGPIRAETPVIWDWGAHEVAIAIDLFDGPPVRVDVTTIESDAGADPMAEVLCLKMAFSGGRHAEATIGNGFDRRCRMVAAASPTDVWVYDEKAPSLLSRLDRGVQIETLIAGETPRNAEVMATMPVSPLATGLAEFAEAIRAGQAETAGLRLGIDVVRVLERAQAEKARAELR